MLRILNKWKIKPLIHDLFIQKEQTAFFLPYLLRLSCTSHNPSVILSGPLQPPLTFLSNPGGNINRSNNKDKQRNIQYTLTLKTGLNVKRGNVHYLDTTIVCAWCRARPISWSHGALKVLQPFFMALKKKKRAIKGLLYFLDFTEYAIVSIVHLFSRKRHMWEKSVQNCSTFSLSSLQWCLTLLQRETKERREMSNECSYLLSTCMFNGCP